MYYSQPDYTWIIVLSAFVTLIYYIILLVYVIKIYRNGVREEKKSKFLSDDNDIYLQSYLGNNEQVKDMVLSTFASECLVKLEDDYLSGYSGNSGYDVIASTYSEKFNKILPEITEEFLMGEFSKLRKFYFKD